MIPSLRQDAPAADPGPWPRRLALATVLCTVPLFAFGGSVTTMGAGMAVDGWWNAEGHFLPFFPIEKWLRDPATFVEHTHRLFGMLVGLFAIALVVVTWRRDARRSARAMAVLSLAAVVAQGTLGGFRVLENSPELAFLHGAFAQGVFAMIAATAAVLSVSWRKASFIDAARESSRLPLAAAGAAALVFVQVVIGAWYRHGLRAVEAADGEDLAARFGLHVVLALLVFVALMSLARSFQKLAGEGDGAEPGSARAALTSIARRLQGLLLVQVLLGMCAWAAHDPARLGLAEGALAVLHVLCGALLLAQTVVAAMWVQRVQLPRTRTSSALGSQLGGVS